jgi:hypothetical protein
MPPIGHVLGILFRPNTEWKMIAGERGDPLYLLAGYVAILALIPAISGFVGASIIGTTVSIGTFRIPMLPAAIGALLGYLLSFVTVYLLALFIDWLAATFDARPSFADALKLSVYSHTPIWLAGIFFVMPRLRLLAFLGLYGGYLVWTGVTPLMKPAREWAKLYAVAIIVCAFILTVLLGIFQARLSAFTWLRR